MAGGAALRDTDTQISNIIFPSSFFFLHQCSSQPPHHVSQTYDFEKITFPFSPYQDLNPIRVDILAF